MLKSVLAWLLTLVLAVGGGAASVWYVLSGHSGAGASTVGAWTVFPKIGAPYADPYTKARIAREGVLALGSAEGVAFIADRDSTGRPLRLNCAYRVAGNVPPSRFWTLFVVENSAGQTGSDQGKIAEIQSRSLLRKADNSFEIAIGRQPAPGNWIGTNGSGPMSLVLTVYDSVLATDTELAGANMPTITSAGCDA